jgi:dTMP kinase
MEAKGEEYFARVRTGFTYEAGVRPHLHRLIDATPDADTVQRAVRREVARLLTDHGWNVTE